MKSNINHPPTPALKRRGGVTLLALCSVLALASSALAQDDLGAAGPLPTLFSVKGSAGWGIGRSRQLYGLNGTSDVWWSTGQGVKLNLALDLPIIPIDVVDSMGSNSGIVPVVGLELEAASGYNISTGGTTNESVGNGFQATTRTASFIPVTLGLNARTSFGGGLPSVYIGAGGGIYLVGIYEENVSYSSNSTSFTRKMRPPLPFALYGALGFELPLMYDPDDANSMFDFFAEVRLTEMSAYIYDYDVVNTEAGSTTTTSPKTDATLLHLRDAQRSASNVSLSLGFKFNLY
jgi:hypothetical protein